MSLATAITVPGIAKLPVCSRSTSQHVDASGHGAPEVRCQRLAVALAGRQSSVRSLQQVEVPADWSDPTAATRLELRRTFASSSSLGCGRPSVRADMPGHARWIAKTDYQSDWIRRRQRCQRSAGSAPTPCRPGA